VNLGEDHPHLVDRGWVADRKIEFGAFDILLLNISSEFVEALHQIGYGHRFSTGDGQSCGGNVSKMRVVVRLRLARRNNCMFVTLWLTFGDEPIPILSIPEIR
jgi:hypothetical protein